MQIKKQIDAHMHSAEHILNQAMGRLFRCGRCFSAHIERKKSKCDYHFDHPLSVDELKDVEREVNRAIAEDLPVSERYISLVEATADFDLSRLPAESGGRIRIVEIGDYDRCPCIGPHITSTGAIGTFRILSSSYENGVLRIRFKLAR